MFPLSPPKNTVKFNLLILFEGKNKLYSFIMQLFIYNIIK